MENRIKIFPLNVLFLPKPMNFNFILSNKKSHMNKRIVNIVQPNFPK